MSKIEVLPLDGKQEKKWDNFLKDTINGTMFHKLSFLKYHPPNKFNFNHLVFSKDANIYSVLPGAIDYNKERTFKSPAGASFGSFAYKDISYKEARQIVNAFIDYCKDENISKIELTFPPYPYFQITNRNIEYELLRRGLKYDMHSHDSIINLNKIKNNQNTISGNFRRAVKKAGKSGVIIQESEDYESFYPILEENLKKHGVKPTHTLEELKKIKELVPENLKLLLAEIDGRIVGGTHLFLCNQYVYLAFYIFQDYRYQKFRPVNLALYEALNWGIKEGYKYFDLGVSQDIYSPNPMDVDEGIISFKESMGARCHFRSKIIGNMEEID